MGGKSWVMGRKMKRYEGKQRNGRRKKHDKVERGDNEDEEKRRERRNRRKEKGGEEKEIEKERIRKWGEKTITRE